MFNKWMPTVKKNKDIETIVSSIQSGDIALQNKFISKYKPFIAKQVSSVCKKIISEHDDEFSIGLIDYIRKFL